MKFVLRTLTIAAIAALPAIATAKPPPRCGLVAFARAADNGAFEIAARGTSCSTARIVAGASRPTRFRYGDPHYTALGFSCSGRGEQLGGHGKHVVAFRCVRARSFVSFLRG